MLIAHTMPTVTDIALTGGTWLTADTWKALVDGRPSRAARIQRSGEVTLTVTLNRSLTRRVIALLGLNVPANTAISADGDTTAAHSLPGAPRCAIVLPASTSATSNVTITIAGTGLLQIGELAIMPVYEVPIEPGWAVDLIDPSESARDRGSQLATAARIPYRRLTAHMQAQSAAAARTWENHRMAIRQDRRCIAIPRHADPVSLHRSAIYGAGRIGAITHLGGDWYSTSLTLDELPAAV